MNSSQMLVCEERGKPEFLGETHSEQSWEPTHSTHTWRRVWATLVGGMCSHQHCSLRQTSQTDRDIPAKVTKNAIEMELKTRNDNHVYHRTWDLVISRLTFEMEWNRRGNCQKLKRKSYFPSANNLCAIAALSWNFLTDKRRQEEVNIVYIVWHSKVQFRCNQELTKCTADRIFWLCWFCIWVLYALRTYSSHRGYLCWNTIEFPHLNCALTCNFRR